MKIKSIIIFFVLVIFASVSNAEEKNNYLQLRYDLCKAEKGDILRGTQNVFENNSSQFALGTKLVTGEKGFILVNPYAFWKTNIGLQFGAKYSTDSSNNEYAGVSIRFIRPIKDIGVYVDAVYYKNLKNGNDKIDIFASLSKAISSEWRIGAETWFVDNREGSSNLSLRPIKLSYVFKNGLAPFIMPQIHWNDKGQRDEGFLGGIELKF